MSDGEDSCMENWFANKGQIIQIIVAITGVLLTAYFGFKFSVWSKIVRAYRWTRNLFRPCRVAQHQEFVAIYDDDLQHVSNRAVIRDVIVLAQSREGQLHPYLSFRFTIVNAAVFPITIGRPTGRVRCLDEIMPTEPHMTQGDRALLTHGHQMFVVIQQSFSRDFAQRINQQQSITVDFSEVRIPILKDGEQRGWLALDQYRFSNIAPL